ncbi:hypothetical protein RIF29_47935 [Crotalaria pallida]|uniref:Uncharacterized protein n=1 Tax=Crotalaria pallida TaxID=3830 RepID=A0AAN9HJQ7_CROPI
MWSESRLAKRMRRYLMLPFACLPLAMRGVVHLIALCLANVSACEWRSGWLCCLAPCSWFGTSSMQPFSCTPCAGVPRCSLVVLVLPTHLAVSVCREDPFLPRPLVEDSDPIVLAFGIGVMINRDSRGHSYFIVRERKLGARRRSDTVLVSTINDADQGSADVAFRTPLAPYEKSKSLGSGGSMVARLKLKGIDGRAPPGVEPAA